MKRPYPSQSSYLNKFFVVAGFPQCLCRSVCDLRCSRIENVAGDTYTNILSAPYLADYRLGWSPFFHKFLPKLSTSQLCRTITRQISLSGKITKHGQLLSPFKINSIRELLSTFYCLPLLPNLRTLTVEYYNPAF